MPGVVRAGVTRLRVRHRVVESAEVAQCIGIGPQVIPAIRYMSQLRPSANEYTTAWGVLPPVEGLDDPRLVLPYTSQYSGRGSTRGVGPPTARRDARVSAGRRAYRRSARVSPACGGSVGRTPFLGAASIGSTGRYPTRVTVRKWIITARHY